MANNYSFNPPYAGGSQQGSGANHPYQQNPYQQPPPGQAPYQQPPYQQNPYGQPPYQQPPYQQPPYQQPPYQQPFHQPPYQPPYQPSSHYEPPPDYSAPAKSHENLLKNPNFEPRRWNPNGETKEFNSEPWQILETGGDGWQLEKGPHGSGLKGCPMEAGHQAHCVVGSNGWCKRSQTIDLADKGFSAQVMDQQKPCIHVYEWFCARSDCDSEYFMNVTLLDRHKHPLDHFHTGVKSAGSRDWEKIEHRFNNYPPGVRFIRFEDGSKDTKFWAGHFGAKMCQPTVKILIAQQVPDYGPTPVNLLTNPSFNAKYWNGNTSSDIDFYPWNIERHRGGYLLERDPSGTPARYPPELSAFDVWCISTSNETSERSQIVDLVQKGYSPQYLDYERPSIKVYEWFSSRTDCEGEYFMKVFLLDQRKNRIPGYAYETSVNKAPSNHWRKEEYVFANIPPGVRYVEFRDGGNDMKNWAGNYGVKMVGAFVGILPQGGAAPPAPAPSRPQLPWKKNLIKNVNFTPRNGWNDNTCKDFDCLPWTIIEDGGDGAILEKTPNGSGAGGYPPELGSGRQHCIASSFKWFRRQQLVDLYEHGFLPHMFQDGSIQIYICEWFTSRGECIGEYEVEVAVLDEHEDEIPNLRFRSGVRQAPGDRWQKVDHVFSDIPRNARYVRFEDAAKDTRYWAGHFGARMVGASVFVGANLRKQIEDCSVM